MSQREDFISGVLFDNKASIAQVRFASHNVLKDISDEQLNDFALFALSKKTKFDNSTQALINAVREYQAKNYLSAVRKTSPFKTLIEIRNFLNEYFKGKIVASGIKPFIYTNISLGDDLRLINENTNKPLNAEDEVELLEELLKNQSLIGVIRLDLIASRIKKRDEIVITDEISELEKIEAKAHHKDKQEIDEAWARLSEFGAKLSFIRKSIA